ncbi:hypothetical protein IIA16_04270 [bacterium]|nr:hypothetical protein [bacterium]
MNKFLKGSITGRVLIKAGADEYPAGFFIVRVLDMDGNILNTTGTDTSGYFKFRTSNNPTQEETTLRLPWGKYLLRAYKPNLGGGGGDEMVAEIEIALRKGVGNYTIMVRIEDVM